MPTPPSHPAVLAAESLARAHHAHYDPSHDFHHVHRVTLLALSIARSLPPPSSLDLLVVHLSALLHDLLDKKYLPAGASASARDRFESLWAPFSQDELSDEQRRLVERVVENVSYSKEVRRIQNGEETEWHSECRELHCVQDADKLDAIGAFGIMRCSAYSAITSRPLYLPPSTSSASDPAAAPKTDDSAIAHFHDKLFRLEGMMKTPRGRELARKRTETMRRFVEDVEREWAEAVGEEGAEA
ncbi:hypothetical protein JCM10207_001467 [Rhodosporidiobolus poonsookiae]